MGLVKTLKDGARKAALTAAVGTALSAVFLGGLQNTSLLGTAVPKCIVSGVSLGISSYASDLVIPKLVPWVSDKLSMPAGLAKFESVILQPTFCGLTVLAFETIFSPETVAEYGGAMSAVMIGGGSSIASYYLLDRLGVSQN